MFTEAPGIYTVTVDSSNFASGGALFGCTATPTLQGSDRTVDSNPNPSGTTPSTLASAGSHMTIVFGYNSDVSTGDFVWSDTNANGIQNSGEPGIQNVTLTLRSEERRVGKETEHKTTDDKGK